MIIPLLVLIVDAESSNTQALTLGLKQAGYLVEQVATGADALERIGKGDVDVALCDIDAPQTQGVDILRQAKTAGHDVVFVMMTAYASVDSAVESMRAGAFDYLVKPLRVDEVLRRFADVREYKGMREETRAVRRVILGDPHDRFGFKSTVMREVNRLIDKVAPTESTVLITGESGTGKGVIARIVHQQSLRMGAPFVSVNCGAIPENLMESELFGHMKGAFTGADKTRKGLFAEADKGTIFLDEIGELPLALQVKLLHVLEEKAVRAVGSEQTRHVNVRIIAATNRDLQQMVATGRFREDLYFRLSVFHIYVPPLRERREDIPSLVRYLLQRKIASTGQDRKMVVAPDAEMVLTRYDWPGNVRELENVVDRALILTEGDHLTAADLPVHLSKMATTRAVVGATTGAFAMDPFGNLRDQLRRFELAVVMRAIEDANGDRRLAAKHLGIGLSSLYRKLEEFGEGEAVALVPGASAGSA